MRLAWQKIKGSLGVALAAVGAIGMPDDIAQWHEWLAAAEPYIDTVWARAILVVLGIAVFLWALDGHVGRGRFVTLPVAAALLNRITFRAAKYIYPLAEAAEGLTGIPRTEFYKRFLVSNAIDGAFKLYEMDEKNKSISPVSPKLLERGAIPHSSLAMHKYDFWKYAIKAGSLVVRAQIKKAVRR